MSVMKRKNDSKRIVCGHTFLEKRKSSLLKQQINDQANQMRRKKMDCVDVWQRILKSWRTVDIEMTL